MPNRQQPLHHPIQHESPGPNHYRRRLLHSPRPAPRIRASRRPQREEALCARAVGDRHLHRLRCLLVRPARCRPAIKSSATGGQTVKDYDKLDLSKNVMLIGLDIVRGRSRGVQKREDRQRTRQATEDGQTSTYGLQSRSRTGVYPIPRDPGLGPQASGGLPRLTRCQ